ncbi:MAG: hypothetical protein P1U46_04060 [Patescibacteria group bacterium]|nr:hypothetical protein [Patescibacteria group bacterium]
MSFFIFSEFIVRLFHSQKYLTQIHSKISKKVSTSPILGTLFSFIFPFIKRDAQIIGNTAFFDQLIFTVQYRPFFQFITNTYFILNII